MSNDLLRIYSNQVEAKADLFKYLDTSYEDKMASLIIYSAFHGYFTFTHGKLIKF